MQEIARALSQMEQVTQRTAAGAQQSAAAAVSLRSEADSMRGLLEEFDALLGTAAGKAARAAQYKR